MARIMTMGEILVEIMASERGQSFRAPEFRGQEAVKNSEESATALHFLQQSAPTL